ARPARPGPAARGGSDPRWSWRHRPLHPELLAGGMLPQCSTDSMDFGSLRLWICSQTHGCRFRHEPRLSTCCHSFPKEEDPVEYRSLGRTGVKVSPLCLGCMTFGGLTDEAESARIIDRALDAGINFLDTANVYNRGRSEEAVGKA